MSLYSLIDAFSDRRVIIRSNIDNFLTVKQHISLRRGWTLRLDTSFRKGLLLLLVIPVDPDRGKIGLLVLWESKRVSLVPSRFHGLVAECMKAFYDRITTF